MKKYEELVTKHAVPKEEQDKQKAETNAKNALRKKKVKLFEQYNAAVDAEESARDKFERAVVDPNVITFDAEFLALQQAEATTKLYKDLYTGLFGELPQQ